MAVLGAVSIVGPSFWVNRYLLFVLLPAGIVAAAALTRTRSLPLPAVALLVVAAAAVPGQLAVRQPTVKNGSDYRTLAAVIRRQERPGDAIVLPKGRTMRAGLDYYLRHDRGRPSDLLLRRSAAQNATLTASEYPDPVARLAATDRIWLVGRRPDLEPFLRDGFRPAGRWTVKNATLVLYIRQSAIS
jgi:hypothetical protein